MSLLSPTSRNNVELDEIRTYVSRQHSRATGSFQSEAEDDVVLRSEDVEPERVIYQEDTIPDGGYGWVCVVCVFWINAHTWGINSVSTLSERWSMRSHPVEVAWTKGSLIVELSTFKPSFIDHQNLFKLRKKSSES